VERVSLIAPAKLNLRLLVGPLGDDGYHPVRTLMVALEGLADLVHVERADARSVRCPGVDERRNLAWAALDALEGEVGRPLPVAVRIEKAIPSEAGLGGGSSNAAAALVATDRLHGLALGPEALERVAARVGSDVPFFVRGGCQWGEGRGERLRPGRAPAFAALLVRPEGGLSTPLVYRAFDRLPAPPRPTSDEAPAAFGGLAGWVRNDLWPAALALRPGLGRPVRTLASLGARAVVMTGSGSCVAGLFPDLPSAHAAAGRLPPGGFHAVVTPSRRGVAPLGA
jgi:4-diphosphocytidyl-2-C-methyl-D-erythritol kinase